MIQNNSSPKSNFTKIPNELIKDTTLSWLARALFCLLASLLNIPGFIITSLVLQRCCGLGHDRVAKALRELREHGYLSQYRVPGRNSWRWFYVLHSSPLSSILRSAKIITASKNENLKNMYEAPTSNYTAISNSIIQSGALSAAAKIIYCYLASLTTIPNFDIHTWAVAKVLKCNIQTIQRYIRVLGSLNLVEVSMTHDDAGRFKQCYIIHPTSESVRSSLCRRDAQAGDEKARNENSGDVEAGDDITPEFNEINLTETIFNRTKSNQEPVPSLEEVILKQCEWLPNRYDEPLEQSVYNEVIQCIFHLYKGNNEVQAIIAEHLTDGDSTLCIVVEEISAECYDRIYHPANRPVVKKPVSYIARVVEQKFLELAEGDWDEGGLHHGQAGQEDQGC
ncbi:hypothetical protein [Dysosmobacter sp. Sow4_B12]|uniref:hypothetical protein n=1 Tax=Dysosmobacter sp. Sow4_B12 TaxID=3438777 RepID=UPI003F937C4D